MKKSTSASEKITELDSWIRQGKVSDAQAQLRQLNKAKIARKDRVAFAGLARRAGLVELALSILFPIVRSEKATDPTDSERIEYANGLTWNGAIQEAIQLLQTLENPDQPKALFAKAVALTCRWAYEETISIWEKYLVSEGLTDYDRLVAKVNLSAALAYEGHYKNAESLIEQCLEQTGANNYTLLSANLIKVGAYVAAMQSDINRGQTLLEQAEKLLSQAPLFDEQFVRKWQLIFALKLEGATDSIVKKVYHLQEKARETSNWELVRELDRFVAVQKGDTDLALEVYFGTPFSSYRRRLISDFGKPIPIPKTWLWNGQDATQVLNVSKGEFGGEVLPEGKTVHVLLQLLCTDFYRPFRAANLFNLLFEGEFYNPEVSPARIHQAAKFLRQWITKANVPLTLELRGGFFRLVPESGLALEVSSQLIRSEHQYDIYLHEIKANWPGGDFSAEQVSERLSIPARTVRRALKRAQQAGEVEKIGKTSRVRYRFVS